MIGRYPARVKLKAIFLQAFLVGLGGFIGALCRYGLAGFVHRGLPQTTFPVGTLVVNLRGCLLIGLLGGFTTFSTFGYETVALARDAGYLQAAVNIGLHVVLGLTLVWLAYGLATSR